MKCARACYLETSLSLCSYLCLLIFCELVKSGQFVFTTWVNLSIKDDQRPVGILEQTSRQSEQTRSCTAISIFYCRMLLHHSLSFLSLLLFYLFVVNIYR